VYKGKIRPWGKTKKSLGKIHIPEQLALDLLAWKKLCPDSSPEAFIFAGEDGQFLDTDSYRKRVLKQLADLLNLPKLTFQVIRRTIATLSQTKGHVKATQGLLRHARTPTTTDVYQQVIPEGVTQMIESVNQELRKPSASLKEQERTGDPDSLRRAVSRRRTKHSKLTPIDTKS
jgi:integrase